MKRKERKFLLLILFFLLVIAFSFSSDTELEKKALDIAHKADRIVSSGNFKEAFKLYEEAANIFKELMEKEPDNAHHVQNYKHCIEMPGYVQLMEGIKYRKKGDSEKAAKYFKAAKDVYGKIKKMFPKQKGFSNNYKYAEHYWYVEKFKVLEKNRGKAFDFYALKIPSGLIKLHDYKGKLVLLDFWVSWCPDSRKSLKLLEALFEKYKKKGLIVIALSMDKVGGFYRRNSYQKAEELAKKYSYLFGYAAPTISYEYGYIDAVPKIFLIDREGKIYKRFSEKERTEENLSKEIEKLL